MQRMGSKPILCINVNITIDTMFKFEANAIVNIDAHLGDFGALNSGAHCVCN